MPVLRATLFDGDGNGTERDLNLGERVSNNDGNFEYSKLLHRWLREMFADTLQTSYNLDFVQVSYKRTALLVLKLDREVILAIQL